MILKMDSPLAVRSVTGFYLVRCGALDFKVVLDNHTVVQHGNAGLANTLTVFIEYRAKEADIVALPFTGFTTDIDHRRILAVNRCGLAVCISSVGFVVVICE